MVLLEEKPRGTGTYFLSDIYTDEKGYVVLKTHPAEPVA
jgi:hypothetical protein